MVFLWNSWNALTRMRRKKKKTGHFLYIMGRVIVIVIGADSLETNYKFCGFNDDLRDTID